MPLGRTPMNTDREPREQGNIIDMSATILTPQTHQSDNIQSQTPTVVPNQQTGAIPKTSVPPGPYNFPPPNIPQNRKGFSPGNNPRVYAGLIREIIAENVKDYRSELEDKIDLKIKESLEEGFGKMIREIKKMNVTSRISDGVESLASEEVEKRSTIEMAPTKGKPGNQPHPQRRLDFRESNSNIETPLENVSPTNDYPNNRPIRNLTSVDKWDISFDGNMEKLYIDDFIFRIEYMLKYHNYAWQDVQGEFHKLLKGDAKDWYWLLVQQRSIESWEELKKALRVQYGSIRSEYELLRDFEERKQHPGESIDDYFLAMRRLRARLKNPLPEYEVIRIIKRNVKQSISQIVYSVQVFSVEHLRDTCKDVERNYFRKQTFNTPQTRFVPQRRQVEEVEIGIDREKETESVEEIRYKTDSTYRKTNNINTDRILCWNCRLPGHLFTDCPSVQRTLFCYKCGLTGVVTPNCPKCSGNKIGSVTKAAESRSTQTIAEQQPM